MSRPRILIVRLGALGDVVLSLPALRLLRRSLPQAGIGWLVEARNAALLEGHPDLNAVFVTHADRWRREPLAGRSRRELAALLVALRRERFDLAIDLQGLFKSVLWSRLAGARSVLGLPAGRSRERLSSWLLSRRAPEPAGSLHVSDLYLATAREALRLLGITAVEGPETGLVALTASERQWAEQRTRDAGLGRFVVLNPGAAWVTKQWPIERFAALARELSRRHSLGVFVAVGPGEAALAEQVIAGAGSPRLTSFTTSVRELAAITERARLFVAGDTGPYHLARALGVPTLGLFGPTDPARNGPREERARVVWGRVHCSPCYGRRCPTAIECMSAIELGEVLARADELLRPEPAVDPG